MSFAYRRWHGVAARLFRPVEPKPLPDLACVIPAEAGGWILEKTARTVVEEYAGQAFLATRLYPVPSASAYLFLHYHWAIKAIRSQPWLRRKGLFAFYTHPSDERIDRGEFVALANTVLTPISMCQPSAEHLFKIGVTRDRVKRVFGAGADPDVFKAPVRPSSFKPVVGVCGAYYPRKRPELIMSIAKALPMVEFRVLGPPWSGWEGFAAFCRLPNVRYESRRYADYPDFYRKVNVFLSTSSLEGGPVPLIEAMMSNVFPVVTDTGFAREMICHGKNGFVLPVDADVSEFVDSVRKALALRVDVRDSVKHRSWKAFGKEMSTVIGGSMGRCQ